MNRTNIARYRRLQSMYNEYRLLEARGTEVLNKFKASRSLEQREGLWMHIEDIKARLKKLEKLMNHQEREFAHFFKTGRRNMMRQSK